MREENRLIIRSAFQLANKISAKAVLLHIDPLDDFIFAERIAQKFDLLLISRKRRMDTHGIDKSNLLSRAKGSLTIPKHPMTRMSIIKIAVTLALSQDLLDVGSKVVCALGGSDSGCLDAIQIIDMAKESEFITGKGLIRISDYIPPELFQSVLNLCVELAEKGREGKPIGTIFVIGDHEKVLQLSKQMIMNPFKGYDESERNIHSAALKETLRELSAMDGAFIIADDGTVLTAGRYLGVTSDETNLPRGLGSRHIAASGITGLTHSIAFVISESSGDIRIFKDGKVIMHLEKAPAKK